MEIQNNSADGRSSPLRLDVTKPMREVVQQRQPLQPPKPTPEELAAQAASDTRTPKDPKAVAEARAQHRTNFQQRVADQRQRYLENEAVKRAGRLEQIAKKKASGVSAAGAKPEPSGDEIAISDAARKLVERVAARAADDDRSREARVQQIKSRYLEGRLNTDGLIARAADKLLGAD